LEALADMVRDEVNRYSIPRVVSVPQYQIVEIPDEVVDDPIVEIYPRDRRSLPLDWPETEEPEYFVFPDEAMIEALRQEQDEQELRDRIAEIAQILNERATRGARFI
uniref:CoA transferase n=1 Tax=Angiostrongylus cantonensis TaxID=6313 RepID=A0A0K0CVC6_ANGCA